MIAHGWAAAHPLASPRRKRGSIAAGVANGSAREGGQAGLIVGLLDGMFGWLAPTYLFAGRPDLNPEPAWTAAGPAVDIILGSILV